MHNGVLFWMNSGIFSLVSRSFERIPFEFGENWTVSGDPDKWKPLPKFQPIAAMNPCPCGTGVDGTAKKFPVTEVERYIKKASRPIPRIGLDIHTTLQPVSLEDLISWKTSDPDQNPEQSSVEV